MCSVCQREAAALTRVDAPSIVPDQAPPKHWVQTHPRLGERVGGCFDLVNPTVDMVDLRVIAMVLARVPRFGGQTGGGVLSVAQHCTEGARAIERDTGRRDWARAFLIHDAHEAYMGDIPTPVAQALAEHAGLIPGPIRAEAADIVKRAIKSLKATLDVVIHRAAGVPWPLDAGTADVVKLYDRRMGRTERDGRMAEPPFAWQDQYTSAAPVEGVELFAWSEGSAFKFYWQACNEMLPALRVEKC